MSQSQYSPSYQLAHHTASIASFKFTLLVVGVGTVFECSYSRAGVEWQRRANRTKVDIRSQIVRRLLKSLINNLSANCGPPMDYYYILVYISTTAVYQNNILYYNCILL